MINPDENKSSIRTSLAVLPFRNLSANLENEHFCDGITDEIINALSTIDELKVISRTSSFYFKNHQLTLGEVADKLKVNVLFEGSVRFSGKSLRIQANLVDVQEDTHVWSNTWDREMEDIFKIQDEISLLIADKLREHLGHFTISEHLVESPTSNLTAYEHLLKGKFHFYKWNPEDVNLAIEQFEQAAGLDPNMTDAHLGLADSYSFMAVAGFAPREQAWAKAIASMQVAGKLDADHPGLNFMLAHQAFFTEADFGKSLVYLNRSLDAKPTYAEAHQFISFSNTLQGDFQRAKDHIEYAKSIDPLNPETRFFEANYYYRIQEFGKAKSILGQLLQDNCKNLPAIILNLNILLIEHELKNAIDVLENTPEGILTPDEKLGLKALIEALRGNQNSAALSTLEDQGKSQDAHHAHSYLFMTYANLGRFDEAFAVLENLFKNQSSILLLGFSDPLTQPIKADPRYHKYHDKVYPHVSAQKQIKMPKAKPVDEQKAIKQLEALRHFVGLESPYLNPSLSLRLLAEQVSIHPNQLSWLLNEYVGKNFNEYINEQRIEHFKKLVLDPANAHISLVGLAYESGFNSKTVFNTAFKKATGMTPKAFQKSHS